MLNQAESNEKTDRIKNIIVQISSLLTDSPPEQLQFANDIVKRLAFMQVLLEDLEQKIIDNGPRRSLLRSYNIQIRSYNNTVKQLLKMLPSKKEEELDDELLKFLRKYQ